MFCPITPFQVVRFEKLLHKQGLFFFSRWPFWILTVLCYLQNWTFCPITPFKVVRIETFLHKLGVFFFKMIILSTSIPMLSSKLNFCPITPFKVVRFEKLLHKQEFFFSRWSFWVPTTLFYPQIWMFCPMSLFQVVRIETFLHRLRSFFQDNYLEYQQPYVIFKIECFVPLPHPKWSELKHSFTNRGQFFKTIILSTNSPILNSKLNVMSHNPIQSGQNWNIPSQTEVIFFKTII